MTEREYTWFIEPFEAQTNLAVSIQLPEENFGQRIAEDGRCHNFWQCSSKQAREFWNSKTALGLNLNIWVREGTGKIRLANHLFKKKRQFKAAS